MSIAVECEVCATSYKVADKFAGKKFKCKECGETCQVPGGTSVSKTQKPPVKRKPVVQEEDDYGDYDTADEDSEDEEESYEAPRKRRTVAKTKSKAKPKKKRSSGGGISWDGSIPPFTSPVMCLGVPAALALLSFVVTLISTDLGIKCSLLMTVVGFVVIFVANIRGIIVAFREDVMCGLAYLFLPFYSLYHLITRWDEHKDPFMMAITGLFIMFFPMLSGARAAGIMGKA